MKSGQDTGNAVNDKSGVRQKLKWLSGFNAKFLGHHRQANRHDVFRKSEVAVHVIFKCRQFDMLNHQGTDPTNIESTNTELQNVNCRNG